MSHHTLSTSLHHWLERYDSVTNVPIFVPQLAPFNHVHLTTPWAVPCRQARYVPIHQTTKCIMSIIHSKLRRVKFENDSNKFHKRNLQIPATGRAGQAADRRRRWTWRTWSSRRASSCVTSCARTCPDHAPSCTPRSRSSCDSGRPASSRGSRLAVSQRSVPSRQQHSPTTTDTETHS